jgi:transposase
MTHKELNRVAVVQQVSVGNLTGAEGARLLGLSLRQVRRLVKRYREGGAAGLAHGNRGRASGRRMASEQRAALVKRLAEGYGDYNTRHLQEVLAERYGVAVSYTSLRALRNEAGYPSPRKRRAAKHRRCRERYPQAGMLLQADGSDHDWLEGRGPRLTLIAFIDDATNEVVGAVFREQEDAAGYLLALRDICLGAGLPLAVYADRHTIFRSPGEPSLAQQLAGEEPKSQFGRVLDELAIVYIPAYSPQAKGRIERLFQTLQDRLVKALREAGACSLAEANQVLSAFLPGFNRRFQQAAAQPGSAYRAWPIGLRPDDVFCFKHTRTVAQDNTLSFAGHTLPIPPGPDRRSYARARVELRQQLDGQLTIHYQGQRLATFQPADDSPVRVGQFSPAPLPVSPHPIQEVVMARAAHSPPASRPAHIPSPDHPWRRSFKLKPGTSRSPG